MKGVMGVIRQRCWLSDGCMQGMQQVVYALVEAVLFVGGVALLSVHRQLTKLLTWEHLGIAGWGICVWHRQAACFSWLSTMAMAVGMRCQGDRSMCFWDTHAMQC